ncbi:MAG: imidazoleglycerol-phosphate dehydratase [Candidatus Omnitrophica bacterium]|nr:imidazoleglycerol-phosphate dehydratase [Candidatus Omnitrophota bacterium]
MSNIYVPRKAPHQRITKETQSELELNLDGSGKTNIKTPIGLLDHMLELFVFHGFFDLNLMVKGDTHIDIHHTNEDVGIVLGQAFKKVLGDKVGIKRFGSGFAPMEDTLGHSVVDISGRGHFRINYLTVPSDKSEDGYTHKYLEHFMESFAKQLGANIIINVSNPTGSTADLHTIMETVFKSLGLALDQATQIDPRRKEVPSTKGIID